MKPVNYDKKRIVSTVILGIFLLAALYFTIVFLPVTWTSLEEGAKVEEESAAGQIVAAGAIGLAMALGMVLVIIFEIGILIVSSICLPFAIRNRHSTLKAIRIISYVYDGLFALMIVTSIVKLILAFIGV